MMQIADIISTFRWVSNKKKRKFSNKAISTHLTHAKMITSHSNVAVIQSCEHECTVNEKSMSVSGT